MATSMQIGETARDRADFRRRLKTGAAIFLHNDGIVAHSADSNTLRAACAPARTNCDARGCKHSRCPSEDQPAAFGPTSRHSELRRDLALGPTRDVNRPE